MGLEGWFPNLDLQGKQTFAWLTLALEISPDGFRFTSLGPYTAFMGVDTIRITNSGTKSLFIDAVIGYGAPEGQS